MATEAEKKAFNKKVAEDEANHLITIGTFNVSQYVNQKPAAVKEAMHIAMREGISVLGVQEYCEFWDLPTSTSKIPGVYDNVSTGLVDKLSWGNGWTGNAIVSKHSLSEHKNGVFSDILPGNNKCGYVKSQFTAYGKVSIYNVHFYAYGPDYVTKHAEELAEIIKKDPTYSKVITGDFNVDNLKTIQPLIDLGFRPAFPFGPDQIDNILVLGHMPVVSKKKVPVSPNVSDHALYYATFLFN
ncbi:endonuclease/exonuclease/phosphatase family protein [Clostridioides mangenotii]|uniref:endonuclease/exonuclease/phosphatase family protein n=1 Tax=Metaclostridioides mangenotii TaxID=1540 RepID=UPI00214A7B73|nr:endonuclease/exonuclease/phosphatase family protein [Clostridioides mangenotii]MCR1954560.1 endonuclease/exonuclease/phosphatase family protein [Clostridioides mangenotii]